MPKIGPSQYECNNMEPGDKIVILKRGIFYKFFRKIFNKNLIQIKIPKIINNPDAGYQLEYQEDCTLYYRYEVECVQQYENQIPYAIASTGIISFIKRGCFKNVIISLNAIQFILDDQTISVPIQHISEAIKLNQRKLANIDDERKIQNSIKYRRYKGDYFKHRVEQYDIKQFEASYCPVCGKPVVFNFNKDNINIENKCSCNNTTISSSKMSYDELSLWYYSIIDGPAHEKNKDFWFGDAKVNE